jgi:ribosomal protein S17E
MDTEVLANEIAEVIAKRSDELLNYYYDNKIDDRYEIQKNLVSLNTLARAYSKYNNPELSKKYRDLFENNYSRNSVN